MSYICCYWYMFGAQTSMWESRISKCGTNCTHVGTQCL